MKFTLFGLSLLLILVGIYTYGHAPEFHTHCSHFPFIGMKNWLGLTVVLDIFNALFLLNTMWHGTLQKDWMVHVFFSAYAIIWITSGTIYLGEYQEGPCISFLDIMDAQTASFLLHCLLILIIYGFYSPP